MKPERRLAEIAAEHRRCFWLDGFGAGDSVLGWLDDDDPSLSYDAATGVVTRHVGGRSEASGSDVFDVLEQEVAASPPGSLWVGYLGYGARPDLDAASDPILPDAVWMRASRHERFRQVRREPTEPSPETSTPTPDRYAAAFDRVQEHLHLGNSYEVNLTYREDVGSGLSPVEAYMRLRRTNPAPYAGFLQHDVPGARGWLLSSSPECYARVDADRVLEARPIKGTTARSADPAQDVEAARRLASDPKYRAENLMIVDLLRNDLSLVCRPGTVRVPRLMEVEPHPAVHQLVSTIRGELAPGVTTTAALQALFPAGSMTGAPKRRTMEIIAEVEDGPRGVYAGAFGWIDPAGPADLGVVIRSLTTAGPDDAGRTTYRLGTGGAITVGSDVHEEYAETRWKASRLLRALGD